MGHLRFSLESDGLVPCSVPEVEGKGAGVDFSTSVRGSDGFFDALIDKPSLRRREPFPFAYGTILDLSPYFLNIVDVEDAEPPVPQPRPTMLPVAWWAAVVLLRPTVLVSADGPAMEWESRWLSFASSRHPETL